MKKQTLSEFVHSLPENTDHCDKMYQFTDEDGVTHNVCIASTTRKRPEFTITGFDSSVDAQDSVSKFVHSLPENTDHCDKMYQFTDEDGMIHNICIASTTRKMPKFTVGVDI